MDIALLVAPGTYSPEKCNLSRQPSFTFGSKSPQKVRSDTPGELFSDPSAPRLISIAHECSLLRTAPSAYATEKVNLSYQPAFSFGSRPDEKIKSDIPGKFAIDYSASLFALANFRVHFD